ncbi:cation transporter, partial [bacterium]|nr:cation transporter [bacterium]
MNVPKKIGLNLLLVFIPGTLVLEHLAPDQPALIFVAAALGIIPLAGLIVQSTEQIAHRTGDAVGGLLNATFGNAPELIIAFVALRAGLNDMVRA